jgi:endoglucanase
VGEFGGRQVDEQSKEGIWQRQFVDYLRQKRLSFAYWSWNPNSADTGGILLDDWQSIDTAKQELLNPLLRRLAALPATDSVAIALPSNRTTRPANTNPSPSSSVANPSPTPSPSDNARPIPSPAPSINPQPQSSATVASGANLRVESSIQSDWQTGFCMSFRVINPNSTASGRWQLTFQMNQAEINQSWNGSFNREGDRYTVTPPQWGQPVQPNQSVDIGFCANKLGSDYQPRQVAVIGME